jgi:ABC-type branched-subunit amino acid transport system permease subunit
MNLLTSDHAKRLGGCLVLGVVLALMVGPQEGNQGDFGYAFKAAVFHPRIFVFLLIGVAVFVANLFWSRIVPYILRPGVRPFVAGAASVVASYDLLNWSDNANLAEGKLGTLAPLARETNDLGTLSRLFYGSAVPAMYWLILVIALLLTGAALITRRPVFGWSGAAVAVIGGVWGLTAHQEVNSFLGSPDHSTGAFVGLMGYFAIAGAAITAVRSADDKADTGGFLERVFSWRVGLPLVVLAAVCGVVSAFVATWFSPTNRVAGLSEMHQLFTGEPVGALTTAYFGWLVWLLLVASLVASAAACWLRDSRIGWVATAVGAVSLLITLSAMHDASGVAAKQGFDGATTAWQNLGVGAWLMCGVFSMLTGAGAMVARGITGHAQEGSQTATSSDTVGVRSAAVTQAIIVVVLAFALFYPPTATSFWQTVLVTEIGTYVLLAVGLNVVVGWAGLLDLGFIAFYAIGSYTTAYLTGTLPIRPPDWLILSPLLAIPFAVTICLLAGLALGAPTLRLRGDYLAIVTLGFGEIIRIIANNADAVTNGPKGAFGIPTPVIHIGPINLRWGQDPLQYWYLLLVFIGVVVLLFRRLENSRLGRAWAAVREDEVAAQASGVNTIRVKLLAFAIGASTSGLAGVFFASQIGFINPDNFLLNNSILVVAYVVFGGMGSLPGAIAGAAALTWMPEFLKDQVPAEDRQMWIGAVILLMMIFRPQGLIPARRRAAGLHGLDGVSSAETTAVPRGGAM